MLESFSTEIKDQQTKTDCREVAVQISPVCHEMAVQTHGEATAAEMTSKPITCMHTRKIVLDTPHSL